MTTDKFPMEHGVHHSLLDDKTKVKAPEISDLDWLMSLDALELAKDDRALDAVIAAQRNARASREAGIKPSRVKGLGVKLDLKALGLIPDRPKVVTKPSATGLRRI